MVAWHQLGHDALLDFLGRQGVAIKPFLGWVDITASSSFGPDQAGGNPLHGQGS